MRITKYRTELNDNLHNILVKESAHNYKEESLNSPALIVEMLNELYSLNRQAEEYLYMIAFNTKCRPLGVFEISHGTVNQSICNPRDIFIRALLCGAYGFATAHNHPSQDVAPSKEDIAVYERLKSGAEMIGIQFFDNLIVGGQSYYSFHENEM